MTVYIDYEAEEKLDLPYEELINKVVEGVLKHEESTYEAEVSVLLTDAEAIHELNKEHRDIDKTTDVLSFPAVEWPRPAFFEFLDYEEADPYFNMETGELMLGDIAISIDSVKAQAKEYGHSEERELAFLIAHSMLHLLGYDHIEDDERVLMEDKQKTILNNLGITR